MTRLSLRDEMIGERLTEIGERLTSILIYWLLKRSQVNLPV
jgi:hypothetical protein